MVRAYACVCVRVRACVRQEEAASVVGGGSEHRAWRKRGGGHTLGGRRLRPSYIH